MSLKEMSPKLVIKELKAVKWPKKKEIFINSAKAITFIVASAAVLYLYQFLTSVLLKAIGY